MNLDHLRCIDLDQPSLEGFRQFISCWLYRDQDIAFLVDPGPRSTIPYLLRELAAAGINHLDYILLTHIHIDHAGGTGALLQDFPAAKVICHPQGIGHMVDPTRLWQGSLQVLGKLATTYGEIIPISEDRIHFADSLARGRIKAYLTPGHAQHHCCFLFEDLLFGGEIAGVHLPSREGIYLRPATPPRFILEVAVESLQAMIALQPRRLVIAHHGLVEPAVEYLSIAQNQLKLWVKGVVELTESRKHLSADRFFHWLLDNDPNFIHFGHLDADLQKREKYFLQNSLAGMNQYVQQLSGEDRFRLRQ